MELKLLLLNGQEWNLKRYGDSAWLLQPSDKEDVLSKIHTFSKIVESAKTSEIIDIIPAYDSITLITALGNNEIEKTLTTIFGSDFNKVDIKPNIHEIRVCYNHGLDWELMEAKTGLAKQKIIDLHSKMEYTVAMIGFLPGFIFLEGLDERIAVSRKESPRTSVPSGSVGIGGNQTGMYSLESPGGWQIIGRTPDSFFNINHNPPTNFKAGDKVRFKQIANQELLELSSDER